MTPLTVTRTATWSAAAAGAVQRMATDDTKVAATARAVSFPNAHFNVCDGVKSEPKTVTRVPPPTGPNAGCTDATCGTAW